MNKHIFFLVFFAAFILKGAAGYSQPGYITTVAGNGTYGFSGDGGLAVYASLGPLSINVCLDENGSMYILDYLNSRIRKVSTGGIITTIAGGGSLTADGVPATSSIIDFNLNVTLAYGQGNLYFIGSSGHIRKIDLSSGIITTIAPTLNGTGLAVDVNGNLYISSDNHIWKMNTAGIISNYAGNGTASFSGDGGPATAAQLDAEGLCVDASGNVFVVDNSNHRIRKINASGIISTYVGSGISGYSGDGGPATAAGLSNGCNICVSNDGSLYFNSIYEHAIRMVSPAGIISTFAGGGNSQLSGIPATNAQFGMVWGVAIDVNNNVYIPDDLSYIWKVGGIGGVPAASSDSFSVYLNSACEGPSFTIVPTHNSSSLHVKTWFGDNTTQTNDFLTYPGCSWFAHPYINPGVYTVKHVLFSGSLAIDSVQYNYTYVLCNTMPFRLYNEINGNCVKEVSENLNFEPVLIEVDSNGVAVDTVSATSGLYYRVYGSAGAVYGFRVISLNYNVICPASGIIHDTVSAGTNTAIQKNIGLQCVATSGNDFSVNAVIPVTGMQNQAGHIYVQNFHCAPANATLTLYHSHKYPSIASEEPTTASSSANTMVWNLNSLAAASGTPVQVGYVIASTSYLTVGDTVHSFFEINGVAGDTDPSNNTMLIIDTVKAGFDPNQMWVSPSKCILSGATAVPLKYTINFENTGNDTAHNICVVDTLSDNVDVASMRIVMSSNEMYTSVIKNVSGHNILKFYFPNINLLDSSHHGKCDGALIFNINTKAGLADGTHIYNRAGIYFDVNDVVMTNGVENVIGCVPEEVGHVLAVNAGPEVYPNPAADVLSIKADAKVFSAYTITNSMGRVVGTGELAAPQTQVSITDQPAGIYFVIIKGVEGSVVRRFVKM